MPQLNLQGARVINPVLTSIAQGFQNLDFIGGRLFPTVSVGQRAGNIITFGKEDFMLYSTQRAPGEGTKRVAYGYSSGTFGLVDYSLEGQLPIELQQEASSGANGFSIDLASITVNKTSAIMGLRLENAQAQIARNAANYGAGNKVTLSGTSQWSDYTGTSNPITVIETAKEAIRSQTGKRPNVCIMGPAVLARLRAHPIITDRMKYTGRDVATTEILASLFGVSEVIVGEAIVANDAGVFSDVWGKDVVLAYTETASLASLGTPTYGYTYQLDGYPIVEQPYYERNSKSWFFPVTRAEAPVLTSSIAGYLIQNAVA
jgi:hypothetical protein